MNNITRVPRPIGSTELSTMYNNTLDNDHYTSLIKNVIFHYIRNNFSYNGIYMNIEQFSRATKLEINLIQKHIAEYGKELYKGQGDMMGKGIEMIRAIQSSVFFWGLEDRSLAMEQFNLLKASQQNSYKPFVSGEVNKALKLVMDSSTNMQQFIRSLGHTGSSSLMPYDPDFDNENVTEKGLTVDDVVKVLKAENITPLKDDFEQQKALALEYGIEALPEVNALRQTGIDKSKEGLNIKTLTTISPEQIMKASGEKGHINRRATELDIDLESDEI